MYNPNPVGIPNNMQRPGNNIFSQPQYPMQPQPGPYQPQSYQPTYATRLQQMEQQLAQSSVPQMAWVNGVEGAKAYVMPPNSKIMLMDSDAPKFYIKETDVNGQPNFKAYRFEEDIQQMPQNNYVVPDMVNTMQQTINGLQQEVAQCQGKIEELYNKISSNEVTNVPVASKVTTKKESASNGKSAE